MIISAYDRGWQDYVNTGFDDNPYLLDTFEYQDYELGWSNAWEYYHYLYQ